MKRFEVTSFFEFSNQACAPGELGELINILYGLLLVQETITHSSSDEEPNDDGQPWICFQVEAETEGRAIDKANDIILAVIDMMGDSNTLRIARNRVRCCDASPIPS